MSKMCGNFDIIKKVHSIDRKNFENKVLLFDFDGTLVETETLAKQVIDHYFVQKNFPGQVPFSDFIVGRTWKAATESIYQYAKERGWEIASPEEMRDEFKARYREKFEKGVRLIPGVLEKLAELKPLCRYMGVVTGSEKDEVKTILEAHRFGHFFDRVWAYGDYAHSKPDPSPYLTAMKDIGCEVSEILVFEDSKAGMESAARAGMPWVQVAHEAHSLTHDPRSLLVIEDWNQLVLK